MYWPNHSDYQDAMQNPSVCFADAEMKTGEPKLDMLGLPRVMSGNFASVYELRCGERRWAIRCFVRQVPGQQGRYARLSEYLGKVTMPYIVGFDFINKGILVKGEWYPVVKMEWVEGSPINTWIEENLNNPDALLKLAADWRVMLAELAKHKIAHGDLQHGNVMVTPANELRLVDYDGMYAPVFGRGRAPELGHANFQHPRRTADFYQEDLDNFAAIVVYTSLRALAAEPQLWQEFYTVDNLILLSSDYKNPLNSKTLERLKNNKDAAVPQLAGLIEKCCLNPIENVPDFADVAEALDKGTLETLPMKTPSVPSVSFSRPAPAESGATTITGTRPVPSSAGTRPVPSAASAGSRSAYDNVATVASTPLRKSTQTAAPKSPGYIPPQEDKHSGIPGWVWGVGGALIAVAGGLVFATCNKSEPARTDAPSSAAPPAAVTEPVSAPSVPMPPAPASVSVKVTPLGVLKGHTGKVNTLAFSGDNTLLASGGEDKTIRVWNSQTGQAKHVLAGGTEAVTTLQFLPDGKTLCSVGADNVVRFWNAEGGELQRKLEDEKDNLFPVAPSPDGRLLATGAADNRKTVRLVDAFLGSAKAVFPNHSSWVKTVGFAPNGLFLASLCHDDTAAILDVTGGKILHSFNIAGNNMEMPAFSPDGGLMAVGGEGRTVKIWDVQTGALKQNLGGHLGDVTCCAFSPDGKLLATGGTDMTVKFWDVAAGMEKTAVTGLGGPVSSVAFAANGKMLAVGGADQVIRLYEVNW